MNLQHLTKTVHHTVYPAISPSNPLNSAQGKTVIVSGGASGIGYAISQSFVTAGAATVVIIARRQEALDEASKNLRAEIASTDGKTEVWTYLVNITNEAAVDKALDDIRARLNAGALPDTAPKDADVLVTSAAHISFDNTVLGYSVQSNRDAFETNLLGNLNLVRAFLKPEMPAIPLATLTGVVRPDTSFRYPHQQKVVLDVSSVVSYVVVPGQATYGASKLAFSRAMQQLHSEVDRLPGAPIRIHSFNPGVVYTPSAAKFMEALKDTFPWDDQSLSGGFAVWLASPAAAFLRGRYILSNWDVEELVAMKGQFEQDPTLATITLKV